MEHTQVNNTVARPFDVTFIYLSQIQYTLYLKEMGLPIHEALQFWMQEYAQESTQNASNKHGCHHNWRTDGRRYTYNIRHMYDLEGSRINYRGHCCGSIQVKNLENICLIHLTCTNPHQTF